MIKEWTKQFGLPFKLYKKNGEEIVLLFLDEKEENEFLDLLEKKEKEILDGQILGIF